jgi:hypothetical protein
MKWLLTISFCLFSLAALADDLTTLSGETYQHVQLISNRCDAESITFTHKSGIARVNYVDMSDADKATYGYDEEKCENFQNEETRRQEQAEQTRRQCMAAEAAKQAASPAAIRRLTADEARRRLSEIRIVNGVAYDFAPVLKAQARYAEHLEEFKEGNATREDMEKEAREYNSKYAAYVVCGKIMRVLPDGLLVFSSDEIGVMVDGRSEVVFVKDYRGESIVAVGHLVKSYGIREGEYRYAAANGATKTAPAFRCGRKPNTLPDEIRPLPN